MLCYERDCLNAFFLCDFIIFPVSLDVAVDLLRAVIIRQVGIPVCIFDCKADTNGTELREPDNRMFFEKLDAEQPVILTDWRRYHCNCFTNNKGVIGRFESGIKFNCVHCVLRLNVTLLVQFLQPQRFLPSIRVRQNPRCLSCSRTYLFSKVLGGLAFPLVNFPAILTKAKGVGRIFIETEHVTPTVDEGESVKGFATIVEYSESSHFSYGYGYI